MPEQADATTGTMLHRRRSLGACSLPAGLLDRPCASPPTVRRVRRLDRVRREPTARPAIARQETRLLAAWLPPPAAYFRFSR